MNNKPINEQKMKREYESINLPESLANENNRDVNHKVRVAGSRYTPPKKKRKRKQKSKRK